MEGDGISWYGEGTWTASLEMGKDRARHSQRRWKGGMGNEFSWRGGVRKCGTRGAEYGNRGWQSNNRQKPATGSAQYIGGFSVSLLPTPMQSLIDSFHLVSCSDSRSLPSSSSSSPVSLSPYDSEDEVIWSLSGSSASAAEHGDDDEDFVLLHKPRIHKTIRRWSDQFDTQESASLVTKPCIDTEGDNTASRFTHVDRAASVTPIPTSIRRPPATREIRPPPVEPPTSTFVLAATQEAARPKREKKFKKAAVVKTTTSKDEEQTKKERKRAARRRRKERKMLQKRQAEVVTPVTKETPTKTKVVTTTTSPEMYEEASRFITSCVSSTLYLDDPSILDRFLACPVAKRDSVYRLTLLQSLMVELGFMSTALPTTLRAARSFVKTHVFLNIKEYISNRGQGQAAIQRLLFPSRNALIKDIKRKGKPASLQWVKQQGLDVLLVSRYNH